MKFYSLAGMILFLMVGLLPSNAFAGNWVDDWVAQSTVTSPGYFAGQQRGYYTGGSFQARWPSSGVTYPVTLTPPKIKSGCGGISVFMGGFSFMNANMLVQKLQAILSNAPAVAFDLALNTLCTPCSNAIKWMEQLSDKLNHLQLDACKLSQMTVAKVYTAAGGEDATEKGLAERTYSMETGISNFYNDTQSNQDAANQQQTTSDNDLISGCPQDIKDVFGQTGSVLNNIAAKLSVDGAHMSFARGLVGDIGIGSTLVGGVTVLNYYGIQQCPQNSVDYSQLMNDFITNNIYQNLSVVDNNNCSLAPTSGLTGMIQTTLNNIVTKMQNQTPLVPSEIDLLNRLPLPMHRIIKTAIATGSAGSTVTSLSDPISKFYVYALLRDILDKVTKVTDTANTIYNTRATGSYGACQYGVFSNGARLLNNMQLNLKEAVKNLENSKTDALAEIEQTMSVAIKYAEFEKQAQSKLSSMFLPSIVNRAMGK